MAQPSGITELMIKFTSEENVLGIKENLIKTDVRNLKTRRDVQYKEYLVIKISQSLDM